MRTMSINLNDKKVRCKMGSCILQAFILVILLLFITVIICYHYAKTKDKIKTHWRTNNVIMQYNYAKNKSYSFDCLLLEKSLTLHNIIIHTNQVVFY